MAALLLLALPLLPRCEPDFAVLEPERPATAHGRYAEALRAAGLDSTALGRDWLAAAERALADPVPVSLAYREASYFSAEQATAVAYRVRAPRGQRVTATLELEGIEPARVFLDVFAVGGDSARTLDPVASGDSAAPRVEWEPRRTGEYLLRVQPELLRSGRYTLTITVEPVLAFPVSGRDSRAIGSVFGVDRDGGARRHHGVDIFAPRGTPVVASAEGSVSRVETTGRGGKVVWLRDHRRGQSLYYAHLDSQMVAAGQQVRVGDTLGLVGNTGNARSTPPHLHFGIYRSGEGPVDPAPWVRETRGRPAALAARLDRLGRWTRVATPALPLRLEPGEGAERAGELPEHTPVRIAAASGGWYRVALPDGRRGWLPARSLEPATVPLGSERLALAAPVRDAPSPAGAVIGSFPPASDVPVLGRFAGFLLVEAPGGRIGWLRAD